MNAMKFAEWLKSDTSQKTGLPFSARVRGNIVSRCRTVERRLGDDLDRMFSYKILFKASQRGDKAVDGLIPISITYSYRTAVRKYVEHKMQELEITVTPESSG